MRKIFLNFCALALAASSASAQSKITDYWQDKPVLHTVPKEFVSESSVIVEENTVIKYEDGDDKEIWMHRSTHRIIKILDEKGIEDFNKMTVPVYQGQELETIKARTITANGTVIDVQKEKMKESKGEDDKTVIVFAMDGVEKNSEVEFLISYKKHPVWSSSETFQFSIPVIHASFDLSAPSRLKFEEKGYNGFPTVGDTVIAQERCISASYSNIPALHEETYGFYDANRMRAEYKLSYQPEDKEGVRIFTWQELVQKLYSNAYELSDKEDAAVEKYLASIGVTEGQSEEEKIKKIESAIKSGITVYKVDLGEDAARLNNVISKKSATEGSLIRLFAGCFFKAGIKHELGVTTNRSSAPLDPDFENWNSLEKYIFYFPDRKKYLSPASTYIRYPFTDADVIGNKGLFCKLTTLGGITKAIADIHTINPMPSSDSHMDILANISFTPAIEATAEVTYTFSGYCAMGVREVVVLLPQDKVKDLVKSLVSIAGKQEDIVKYNISGEGFDNYSAGKPMSLVASVKAPQLTEKAGPKYLFKIGDVIGKQSELYQTTERKQPIDFEYPHTLARTIIVNLPSGFKILNPETLNIKTEMKDAGGEVTAAFTSDYKIDGDKLTVNINEVYNRMHFPISDYENFRKVINASADFNKVTLLMQKM